MSKVYVSSGRPFIVLRGPKDGSATPHVSAYDPQGMLVGGPGKTHCWAKRVLRLPNYN